MSPTVHDTSKTQTESKVTVEPAKHFEECPPSQSDLQVHSGMAPGASRIPSWLLEGQPARICFMVAFIAFTAAAASWVITSLLSGWMEIAGMVAVGLFYLGLGLVEVGRRSISEI